MSGAGACGGALPLLCVGLGHRRGLSHQLRRSPLTGCQALSSPFGGGLQLRALAPELFRMGWDLVLTDEGPCLLEANCVFDGNFLTDLEHSEVMLDAMRDAIERSLKASRV